MSRSLPKKSFSHCFDIHNSKLSVLRQRYNYILFGTITHLINLFLYSLNTVGLATVSRLSCLLVISTTITISSCTSQFHAIANQFRFGEYGKESMETTGDVIAHIVGCYLAFRPIKSIWYKIGTLVLICAVFCRNMLSIKTNSFCINSQANVYIRASSHSSFILIKIDFIPGLVASQLACFFSHVKNPKTNAN
jgi:hypothetical protein